MIVTNHWEENAKRQWIFYAKDNSSLEGLSEKINSDEVLCSSGEQPVNLGIKKVNGCLYSGNYVGICRLKNLSGRNIFTNDNREVILKVEPRFPVSVVEMLNCLRDDDEFERYLAPQTNRIQSVDLEVEDLKSNELFHFDDDDDPIYLQDNISRESSIIAISVFVTMLKALCSRPLMGRMISKEENLVGKIKGKIVFNKNLRNNTLRGRDDRVYCRYLQYTDDIIENQVLKLALHKSELFLNQYFGSISGEKNTFREIILYCRKALSHISSTRVSRIDLNTIKTTGVYAYYKPVLNAAKMVLNEITLEANGTSVITNYVVPYAISMEKLFEFYIRAFFKKAGVKTYDTNETGICILRYDNKTTVLKEKNKLYANYISGNIKPDIIIYDSSTENYVVFDVKYKDASNSRFARNDRMQILAYGLMLGCDNVGNIFPSHDGTNNICFKSNQINSKEKRMRYYNQMEIAIDADWKLDIIQNDNKMTISVIDYLKSLLKSS